MKLYYDMIQAHCTANLPPPPLSSLATQAKSTAEHKHRATSPSSLSSAEGDGSNGALTLPDDAVETPHSAPPTGNTSEGEGEGEGNSMGSLPDPAMGSDDEDGLGAVSETSSGLLARAEMASSPLEPALDGPPSSDPDIHDQMEGTGAASSTEA